MNEQSLAQAVSLLRDAKRAVALTGAGISTPSGIPDFRSPNSGLWNKIDPMEVATIDVFLSAPKKFFEFMGPISAKFGEAEPNAAHTALAELESMGRIRGVITQNIDNLHQRAGSANVIELHGNGDHAHCLRCKKEYRAAELEGLMRDGVPRCECDGLIKPDVVLFGESLPVDALDRAQQHCRECDVLLVAGSSLTVMPASFLPQMALQSGARVIVVNLQPTYMDSRADVVMHERVEVALPEFTRRLRAAS